MTIERIFARCVWGALLALTLTIAPCLSAVAQTESEGARTDPAAARPITLSAEQMRLILDSAGLTDFFLLTDDEIAKALPGALYAWTDGGAVAGALFESLVERNGDFAADMTRIVAFFENSCGGVATARQEAPSKTGDGGDLQRFSVACAKSGRIILTRGFAFGGTASILVFTHLGAGEAEARLIDADNALYNAFVDIMR